MQNLLSLPGLVSLGGLNVALVDLIVLIVLAVSIINGAYKGFVNQIFAILGGFAALILAICFCGEVKNSVATLFPSTIDNIALKVNQMLGIDGVLNEGAKEQIVASLASTSIPAFLHGIVADLIIKIGVELQLETLIAGWILTGICFVAIFILALVAFAVVKKYCKKLLNNKVFGKVDRILGGIFSALKTVAIIIAVSVLASLLFDVNSLLTPVTESGEQLNSVLNAFMTWFMNLGFITNLLAI